MESGVSLLLAGLDPLPSKSPFETPSLLVYLSRTAPAATASARTISVESESARTANPPFVEVRDRFRAASVSSRTTPIDTVAPTAVSEAVTSPFVVDFDIDVLVAVIELLSVIFRVPPVPT